MKFSNIRELQKAYTEGIYSDSPLNRKLGRVGMTYTAYAEYTQRKKEGEDVKINDFRGTNDNLNKNKIILKDRIKVLDNFNSTTISLSEDHKAFIYKEKGKYNVIVVDKDKNVVDSFTYTSKENLLNNFNAYLYEADLNIRYTDMDKAKEKYVVLSSTDTDDKEDFPEGDTKNSIIGTFKDYLMNGKEGYDVKDDSFHIITKDGKLISFMGEDGNDREENPWKSPNLSDIQYIEHYGSDDHTFWYSENADGNKIKELTGFTLKGLIYPNISVDDFSDSTKELYNQAKKGKNLVEFVDRLVENDFPKNDIEDFITIEFKDDKKLLLNYLNNKSEFTQKKKKKMNYKNYLK